MSRGVCVPPGGAWRSRERSRRQTSGRWIDDSEDSDDGEFNLGAGAMDAFKAPPAYPLAGAGPSSAAPGPNVDAEITPVTVDPTLSFSSVGGLDKYVDALKEMVFLPLLYPEVFARFKMSPPRGVLLYGAPGTGKRQLTRRILDELDRRRAVKSEAITKHAQRMTKLMPVARLQRVPHVRRGRESRVPRAQDEA